MPQESLASVLVDSGIRTSTGRSAKGTSAEIGMARRIPPSEENPLYTAGGVLPFCSRSRAQSAGGDRKRRTGPEDQSSPSAVLNGNTESPSRAPTDGRGGVCTRWPGYRSAGADALGAASFLMALRRSAIPELKFLSQVFPRKAPSTGC